MIKIQIKYWLKKDNTRIFLISLTAAAVCLLLRRGSGILLNLSDLLFTMGAVHIVVGGARYIRNVGLFKTFSYIAYKKRWKQSGMSGGEVHPMSLAEYTANVIMDETRQRPVGFPLCAGMLLFTVSLLLAV